VSAWRRHSPAFLSALLALVLYSVTLWGTYVYDDYMILREDPRMTSPARWHQFWTQSYNGRVDNLYRPLTSLSYAVQLWLHGSRPWAFHLVNLLLHAVMSALVAVFAMRLTEMFACSRRACSPFSASEDMASQDTASELAGYTQKVGLLAGLLFAAHPVHVEAVANIVGRAELLCGIGTVAGLILVLKRPMTGPRVLAIVACYLFAMLTKEMGILFPVLIFALMLCRRLARPQPVIETSREQAGVLPYAEPAVRSSEVAERRAMTWLVVLLCWILAGYIIIREQVIHLKFWWDRGFLDWAVNPLVRMSTGEQLLMPITIFGHYIALLFAPLHLSPDYSGNAIGLHFNPVDPYFVIGVIAIVLWLLLAIFAFVRRNGAIVFCVLAFGITYGVISNFASIIGTIFGERLIYLPSTFFIVLVSLALARLSWKILAPLATCVLLLASLRTFTYARLWNDKVKLFETTLEHHPDSIRLYLLLANELRDQQRFTEAKAVLDRGAKQLPGYWETWLQAGITALMIDDLDEAQRCFLEAMKLQPGVTTSYWYSQVEARRAATRPATKRS
jgi:hypothetical protein